MAIQGCQNHSFQIELVIVAFVKIPHLERDPELWFRITHVYRDP
jgi:hypothetical protein